MRQIWSLSFVNCSLLINSEDFFLLIMVIHMYLYVYIIIIFFCQSWKCTLFLYKMIGHINSMWLLFGALGRFSLKWNKIVQLRGLFVIFSVHNFGASNPKLVVSIVWQIWGMDYSSSFLTT